MFERFTDRARRVVVRAQEEARFLNHNYIGTEHVLLGLISEPDAVSTKALVSHGLDLNSIRRSLMEIIGQGSETLTEHIPFTPRAKKVLELSLRESLQMGHNYIGSEHILLGLIREGEGVAAQILNQLGVSLEALRVTVGELVSIPASGQQVSDFAWEGRRRRSTCRHLPEALSIEVHDVPITGSQEMGPVRILTCTACGTTIGAIPA